VNFVKCEVHFITLFVRLRDWRIISYHTCITYLSATPPWWKKVYNAYSTPVCWCTSKLKSSKCGFKSNFKSKSGLES